MEINVTPLLTEIAGSSLRLDLSEEIFHKGGVHLQKVCGSVTLTRTDEGISAKGNLIALYSDSCGRCLQEFDEELSLLIEQHYRLGTGPPSDSEVRNVEGPQEVMLLSRDQMIDIGEILRQSVIANIPIKPLCHFKCSGLCPECGTNWNHGSCQCLPEVTEPGWKPLDLLLNPKLVNSLMENP